MLGMVDLSQIAELLLVLALPTIAIYFGYLIITKAFNDMGFSSFEAILIVFISALFGFTNIVINGFSISNVYLFTYNELWRVSINMGGALIPIFLSIYLIIKKKLPLTHVGIGLAIVTFITYMATYPNPEKGIVSPFPYWLLPALFASIVSVFLFWKKPKQAAPFAYVCGTLGVLIGADFLHLWELLNMPIETEINAVIGGANVFDMIFITGIIAVIIDGIFIYQDKSKEK